jgi:hypothetical protein
VTPQICDSDFSPLDCSYRFKLVGQDLVLASASEDVYARLALVGPAYVTDAAGGRWTLVRVRVSAFHGSVSVDPTEVSLGLGRQQRYSGHDSSRPRSHRSGHRPRLGERWFRLHQNPGVPRSARK